MVRHLLDECPNHAGAFDCTPFCPLCLGEQEIEKELTWSELKWQMLTAIRQMENR
jgi:hypothetical protein